MDDVDYTYDDVGNRLTMVDDTGTTEYDYDALYRLTEVTYPDQETDAYTYDAVGNRLTKDSDDYTYDTADQLTDLEGTSFDYDDNGNQTGRGNDTFEYDHENRLVESVIDSVTSTSVYNGDGLRMSHTVGQTTTSYIWDVASGLAVVLQDGTNTYVYGLDLISAADGQGDQTYFLYDGLGSVTDLADDEADVVDGYTYDVFGAIRSQSGSSENYWLFTGEQRDSDSGLYYLRARYYDPGIGRFLGRDPARTGLAYGYSGNNPVRFSDGCGLDFCETVGGLFGKKKKCKEVAEEGFDEGKKFVTETLPEATGEAIDLLGNSYYDVNLTLGCGIVGTAGVQFSWKQGVHPYAGGGIANYCGGGASVTAAPRQSIAEGLGCGVQYGVNPLSGPSLGALQLGVGPTVQFGTGGIGMDKEGAHGTPFGEVGVGGNAALSVPGISIPGSVAGTCYYVFPDIWPF